MLLPYALLLLPYVLVAAQGTRATLKTTPDRETLRPHDGGDASVRIGEVFPSVAGALHPVPRSRDSVEESRHKKIKLNKYVVPLIVGFLLIKSILLPIALKALAVLSGKAVVLSLMSLILAAIVGLKKVAQKEGGHYNVNKHRRQDIYDFVHEAQEFEPYRFYKERRRRR